MSRYVRIDGILEEDWVKRGWDRLQEENDGTLWGHRLPVVVDRAWKKVSVKAEVRTAPGAYDLVRSRVRWGGVKKFVQVCVAGGARI